MAIQRRERRQALITALGLAGVLVGCRGSEPATPEDALAKGKDMVRSMSDQIAAAKEFTFSTDEVHERIRSGGGKDTLSYSRDVAVRRPDRAWFRTKGTDRDSETWYDGDSLTIVGHRNKVWAKVGVPSSLDETMDYMAVEYDLALPWGDLLYSSPYDAVIDEETTGGWQGVEKLGNRSCNHLAFQADVVDWEIWITDGEKSLPCQLLIIYKEHPERPTTRVTFRDLNPAPQLGDDRFTAVVPSGFQHIPMVRRPPEEDVAGEAGDTAAPAPDTSPAAPDTSTSAR